MTPPLSPPRRHSRVGDQTAAVAVEGAACYKAKGLPCAEATMAESKQEPAHPAHTWGALAANPSMEIGGETEASREMLRRFWVRNGGLAEDFERLAPPRGKARRPDQS